MHGTTNLKFINAKQAGDIHAYKNIKQKLRKTRAVIWFNKTCRKKDVKPNYLHLVGCFIRVTEDARNHKP
jgi:hypothetical protein